MKFRRTIISVSIATAMATLSACGGGGGGGYVRANNPVPYYTPTKVGVTTPLVTTAQSADSSALFSENLSGTGQELIIAGRATPNSNAYSSYNLSIFGWQNGALVNKTNQWFSGTDNIIIGSEPSVKFGDFNGDGKTDMYVAPNSDTNVYGPGAIFLNNGTSFSRTNINVGNISGHDSALYDLNHDGITDIVQLSFAGNLSFIFGSSSNNFVTYTNTSSIRGGAGIAVGDFLTNGSSSLIITDSYDSTSGNYINKLVTWSITGNNLELADHVILPTPRFLLPKWASYNFAGNHEVRALAFDFDNSGKTSAVIFSRPWLTNGQWPNYSEVQFLKNQGGGVFIDVTDTVLVGYNTNTTVSYNPKLMDVNSDGLIDIVLSSPNWNDNSGSQVLIHTTEHKYVSSYATVLKAFQDQALNIEKAINSSAGPGGNGIVFIQGPDGSMYLATAVSYNDNGTLKKSIYLSKLGATTATAQATATSIKQQWPWMNDAQVNAVLSQSSTTWFGLNVLDPNKALQPIGTLTIPGSSNGLNLSGHVTGLNLKGAANNIKAIDSVGRDFNVDYSVTSFNVPSMFTRFVDTINDDTRSAQLYGSEIYNYQGLKAAGSEDNKTFVLGYTGISINDNTQMSVQYTRLPFSPFVSITGAWGMIRSSDTIETTVSYKSAGWATKLGLMYTSTEIYSGLITRINPITSVWTETGYEWKNLKLFGGILPKPIAGSANLTLPTGIDNYGRISYTNSQVDITSPTITYARLSYSEKINRYATFRFNAMVTSQKQQNVLGEVRFQF